ncbi:enoyl-CoA hydratase/isomerase family protein [Sphingomonas oligophenolica]|uniref:Enoyl-CoA hydratase/isomerase family protein n=1 Tax=Sphingomonas oligophenolica TaxID=301154 RepID=A0ABU9YB52_9SPHN
MSDIRIERRGAIAIVEICRPPNNFFDVDLLREIADAFDDFDADKAIRCIVLCAEGKNFCAGANFAPAVGDGSAIDASPIYTEALRLFRVNKPVVAVVQGGAIGGGLGLALTADFRVASAETRFAANFNRLGIHPGFGLSVTLPRVVGVQRAAMLFYTGQRFTGIEAHMMGLVDVLAEESDLRNAGLKLAGQIALSAPLAVTSTRRTLRRGLADDVANAIEHELREQDVHFRTADFKEGVRAMGERRVPQFSGD